MGSITDRSVASSSVNVTRLELLKILMESESLVMADKMEYLHAEAEKKWGEKYNQKSRQYVKNFGLGLTKLLTKHKKDYEVLQEKESGWLEFSYRFGSKRNPSLGGRPRTNNELL